MAETLSPAVHERVREIFDTALEEAGGPTRLLERREQDLMPALAESAVILVLSEEFHQSPQQIAEALGVNPGAVDSVLSAPMEGHRERLKHNASEQEEFARHEDPEWSGMPLTDRRNPLYLAGSLAKFAYGVVRRRHEMPA